MKVRAIYILLFLLSSILLNGQTVNVSGLVISSPLSNPIDNANIKILNPSTNEELASTTTNNEGLYSIDFIITNIPIESRVPNKFLLSNAYPNPFNPSTNINFTTPISGRFNIEIYNILGERIYHNSYNLDKGGSRINISDLGSAGIYFFRISNKDYTKTTKLILLDGGNNNTKVKLLSGGDSNSSLSKNTSIDSILVRFSKEGYNDKDTTISISEGILLNSSLPRIPKITETEITTMKIIGEDLPNFPVHFVLGDKDSIYTSNEEGIIPFRYVDYNDPYIDSMKVYIDDPEDESSSDLWMGKIIVKQNHPDANMGNGEIAQNVSINRNLHENLYVSLDDLTQAYNVAMKFTPRFGMLGDELTVMDMKDIEIAIISARGGTTNARWMKYEVRPGVISDTLYTILFTHYYNNPAQKVEEILIDNAREQLNLVLGIHTNQENGSKTLTTSEVIEIPDTNHTKWQHIKNTLNLNNVISIRIYSVGGPGNALRRDGNRWKDGYVNITPSTGPGSVMSELTACLHGMEDGNNPVGYYFAEWPNFDKVSEFGKILGTYQQEHKEGEPFLKPPTP